MVKPPIRVHTPPTHSETSHGETSLPRMAKPPMVKTTLTLSDLRYQMGVGSFFGTGTVMKIYDTVEIHLKGAPFSEYSSKIPRCKI